MASHTLQFNYQHRFELSHHPTGKEDVIWMVLHGYGQLARFFIRKFESVKPEGCMVVAPEGINHHYLNGFSGRVGANWMTKHERETDIQNVMAYLNEVMHVVLTKVPKATQINVLGFSQGAAMISRWIAQSPLTVHKAVFWGGGMAHDLDSELIKRKLFHTKVTLALGDQDHFVTEDKFKEQQELLEKLQLPDLQLLHYNGGHDLEPELLNQLFLS